MPERTGTDALLQLNLTLHLSPSVSVAKEVPVALTSDEPGSFLLHADAALQYASFSQVLRDLLTGKRIELSEGLFAKHVVIKNVRVSGGPSQTVLLHVDFSGSFKGAATFSAVPVYNQETASIILLHLRYNLQTSNLLLKGARLLFASRIEKELKKITRFPVGPLFTQIETEITALLSKEWRKGIKGAGAVKDLRLTGIEALPEHLLLRVSCEGSLQIIFSEIALNLKR